MERADSKQPIVAHATPAAVALHKNFCNSVAGLRRDLVRSITYLRLIFDRKVYRALGYASIYEYAMGAAGLTENQCRSFLKIGRRLGELPAMREALAEGSISWTKASHIASIASRENEVQLLDFAKSVTAEQLRVSAPRESVGFRGAAGKEGVIRRAPVIPATARKQNPLQAADIPCYVSFRFTAEQYEIWSNLTARHPGLPKEEVLLQALADSTPSPPAAADTQYLVVLHECPSCGRATLKNNRGEFIAPRPLIESAHCDSMVENEDARRRHSIPPRLRRAVFQRDHYRCQAAGCNHTQFLQIHHRVPRAQGGASALGNLVTLCSRCHRALHEQEETLRSAAVDPAS